MKFCFSFVFPIALLALLSTKKVSAQEATSYARRITKELCDKKYLGRGYVQSGVHKAATWLEQELKRIRVKRIKGNRRQRYSFPMVVQEGKVVCEIDHRSLKVGRDYLIQAGAPSVKGKFVLRHFNGNDSLDMSLLRRKLESGSSRQEAFVLHHTSQRKCAWIDSLPAKSLPRFFIFTEDKKITHTVSTDWDPYASLVIFDSLITGKDSIHIEFSNHLIPEFSSENIVGMIKGKRKDSCLVITAHYDHLGMQGDAMFPGASDNASGVSMVLNLAKYFRKHKPPYTTYIILFSGEEAGLLGSRYFVENPMFDLKKVKLLLNLDIMGNVENGITVVNGEQHKKYYDRLKMTNHREKYVKEVKIRSNAANSDHYPFSLKGVPAIFIYTLGGPGYYHDIDDTYENLSFDHYEPLYELLVSFIKEL